MDNKQKSINKMNLLLRGMAKAKGIDPDSQVKPDWITDEQWKAVPSVEWWENNRKGAESIAQSKPQTMQEIRDQFSRLRNSKNSEKMNDWNEKEVQAVAEMQRQPVDWEAIDKYVKMAGGRICRAGKKFKKESQ
jgi:hypothetical protein